MENSNKSVLITKLEKNVLFNELVKRCDASKSEIIALVKDVGEYAINKSKVIIKYMPEFTLHDQEHLFNMLHIAGKLIPKEKIEKLSIPDLMMIIITIFLHDIGMSPEENLVKAWKNQLDPAEEEKYEDEVLRFKRFRKTFHNEINAIEELQNSREYSKAQLLEDKIITDYIRSNHAQRARKMIADDWSEKLRYKDIDLTEDVANICFSHNKGSSFILDMETLKLCDEDTYLCIPFVAIILRLCDIVDFDPKRTPDVLFSHISIKNPVSLLEWKKHQSINAWNISPENLIYSAQCSHPAIESAIYDFCNQIDEELRDCTFIISNLKDESFADLSTYKIQLPTSVNRSKITAKKDIVTGKPIYRFHETRFNLSKKQVIDLLMGTKLYGNSELALRELLQNSIDACILRQKLSDFRKEDYIPKITVSLHKKDNIDYLSVNDNGIGMNQHIIDEYYTNIGNSYYKSSEFYELVAELTDSFKPISRFGIGILACFMVCDSMEVNTRKVLEKFQYDDPIKISVEGYDSLFILTDSKRQEPGTDTTLKLRKTHPWERMDDKKFIDSVEKLVPLPPFPINVETDSMKTVCSPEKFDELDLDLEDDHTWVEDDSIQTIDFDINSKENGFRGKASIAYIVSKGSPVKELIISSRDVIVDGEIFSLDSSFIYSKNCIQKHSTSLEINEDGNVESNTSTRDVTKSKSFLSIHGIDLPSSLFSDYSNWGEKSVLEFPFPMRIRLDIGRTNDLNLNSARTKIIYDELWLKFETKLFELICNKMKDSFDQLEWNNFKKIMLETTNDEQLKRIINQN